MTHLSATVQRADTAFTLIWSIYIVKSRTTAWLTPEIVSKMGMCSKPRPTWRPSPRVWNPKVAVEIQHLQGRVVLTDRKCTIMRFLFGLCIYLPILLG